jgi:outer membrane protein TolC
MKRKEVGLATTRQVLEAEEDLAQARTDESASRADYHNAVTVYWQVSGQLLEIQGVRFSGEFRDESRPLLAPHQP